jgi:aconitate hydratase
LRIVIAKSFARIHQRNLVNFGILPLIFCNPEDYESLGQGAIVKLKHLVALEVAGTGKTISTRQELSEREIRMLLAGGLINQVRRRVAVGP